jgi:hypothetical protein
MIYLKVTYPSVNGKKPCQTTGRKIDETKEHLAMLINAGEQSLKYQAAASYQVIYT